MDLQRLEKHSCACKGKWKWGISATSVFVFHETFWKVQPTRRAPATRSRLIAAFWKSAKKYTIFDNIGVRTGVSAVSYVKTVVRKRVEKYSIQTIWYVRLGGERARDENLKSIYTKFEVEDLAVFFLFSLVFPASFYKPACSKRIESQHSLFCRECLQIWKI